MHSCSSSLVRYGVGIGAVVASLICTQWFATLYHQGIVFMMLGGVMLAAWFGGRGPGFLATALSAVGALYFVVPPESSFLVTGPADVIRLTLFVGVCVLIVMLTDTQHKANAMLVKSKETLEHEILKRRDAEETLRVQGQVLEQLVGVRTAELQKVNQNLNEEIVRRIKVEETLRQSNEALESQVLKRTRQLTEANEALQEKVHDLEKFYDLVVGRELKMIELEKEMEAVKARLLQAHPSTPVDCPSAVMSGPAPLPRSD